MEKQPSIPHPGGELRQGPDTAVSLPSEHAFVVQFRADAGRPGYPQAGRVEHILSGRAARFSDSADLLAFMASVLGTLAAPAPPAAPGRRRTGADAHRTDVGDQPSHPNRRALSPS